MSVIRTTWFTPLWNVLWRVGVVLLALYVIWHTRSIIVMTLFAATFAYAVAFGVDWLLKTWDHLAPSMKHLPIVGRLRASTHFRRITAVLICYLLLGVGAYWATASFIGPIRTEAQTLTRNWNTYRERVTDWRDKTLTPWYEDTVPISMRKSFDQYTASIDYSEWGGTLVKPAAGILQSSTKLVGWFVEIILVPILAFYFLVDGRRLKREMFLMIPRQYLRLFARICFETNHIMRSYVKSQAILCLIAGVVTWAMLLILDLFFRGGADGGVGKYAVMLGIYAGLTRAIPVLGPLIGGIPVVVLAAFSASSVHAGVIIAALFTTMHFVESKFIMPLIVGEKLDLHAVWVILSLLIGAEFFGLIGMFFAAPVTAIARNVWRYYYLPRKVQPSMRFAEAQLMEEKERLAT